MSRKSQTKIYYSNKSESSIEEMMGETPSNYNIPNGRLEGESKGMHFKKKTVKVKKQKNFSPTIRKKEDNQEVINKRSSRVISKGNLEEVSIKSKSRRSKEEKKISQRVKDKINN